MSEKGITLKLLINRESNKVIFAESGKEFVDFLLGFLQMPLGYVLRLLNRSDEMGSLSLGNVYASVQDFDNSYLQKSELRNSILNPNFSFGSEVNPTPLLRRMIQGESSYSPKSSDFINQSFPFMNQSSSFSKQPFSLGMQSSPASKEVVDGYVKGAVTYMVMDDLTIKPFSTISSISLFNCKGVKDMGTLQEKIVQVDGTKGLEIVRAAFQSSMVLTDVFIGKDGKTAKPTT